LLRTLLTTLIVLCGIPGIVFFFLYGRARMKENERQEKLFLKLHYTFLSIVVLLGIIWMFLMVETET
jgi:preprotein translocase subunit YajC